MNNENPNPINTSSQCKMMRAWFVANPEVRVTAAFFYEMFGISKTATRVGEIINGEHTDPLAIDRSSMYKTRNRYGKCISVREYFLPKSEAEKEYNH